MPTESEIASAQDAITLYQYESAGPDWQVNVDKDLSLDIYKNKRRVKIKTISSASLGYKLEINYKYQNKRDSRCFGATRGFRNSIISL